MVNDGKGSLSGRRPSTERPPLPQAHTTSARLSRVPPDNRTTLGLRRGVWRCKWRQIGSRKRMCR
eukprot:4114583-Alexandrium_andersonii.AAC.1